MRKNAHYRERIRRKNAEKHNRRSRERAQANYRVQEPREKKEIEEQELGFLGLQALSMIQNFRQMKLPKKKDYSHRKT